jgi:hypothetical protein
MSTTQQTIQRLFEALHQANIPHPCKLWIELDIPASNPPLLEPTESISSADATLQTNSDYQPIGMDILDMDKGFLRSFGYENVRDLTINARQKALRDAVNYGNDPKYIQERLYYIAYIQTIQNPNPFKEDLKWFEKEYELESYSQ